MTTQTEALKLALEALEEHGNAYLRHEHAYEKAITAAEEALAHPTQGMTLDQLIDHVGGGKNAAGFLEFNSVKDVKELIGYVLRGTTPPQRKPLTDEQIDSLRSGYQAGRIGSFVELCRAIEAAHGIKE